MFQNDLQMSRRQGSRALRLTLCALFTALISAGAFIRIPVPVVPFTLHPLFTMLAGLLLGGRDGAFCVGAYILLGLMGLPIFAEGGGIWYLGKPSFGYLIGFFLASYVTGKLAWSRKSPSLRFILLWQAFLSSTESACCITISFPTMSYRRPLAFGLCSSTVSSWPSPEIFACVFWPQSSISA